MKEKIVFFILGGLIATFSYLTGDMTNAKAKEELEVFQDVVIMGKLIVAGGELVVADLVNFEEPLECPSVSI